MIEELSQALLSRQSRIVHVRAGELLFEPGDTAAEMYILLSGTIRLTGGDEPERVLAAGALIGTRSLLAPGTRSEAARAEEECNLMAFTRQEFDLLKASDPPLAARILRAAARGGAPAGPQSAEQAASEQGPAISPSGRFPLKGFQSTPLLYKKEVACPICETTFEVEVVRETRLAVAERTPDLRISYRDVEPLWYRVWACPRCLFAGRRPLFEEPILSARLSALQQQAEKRRERLGEVDFTRPRDLALARAASEAGYLCAVALDQPAAEQGTLALGLAWLADDAGDGTAGAGWRETALAAYRTAFEKEVSRRKPKEDQRLAQILGVLLRQLGRLRDALPYFLKAVQLEREGDRWLAEQARDEIRGIRALLAEEQEPDQAERGAGA